MKKIRNPKDEIRSGVAALRSSVFSGTSKFLFRIWPLPCLVFWSYAVLGAVDEERIPPLQPPHEPLPPDFWELYGVWVVVGGALVLLLVGLILWLIFRARPPVVVPPGEEARSVLGALRQQPETGNVLSRVSHALRHYFGAAFGLAEGEMTTTEFCRALDAAEAPDRQLKGKVATFLRECDERKFSPAQVSTPMGAANQALNFVAEAEAEARRAQLRTEKQP